MRRCVRLLGILIGLGTLVPMTALQARGASQGDAFLAKADEALRGRPLYFGVTAHYRVRTDDERLLPQKTAAMLEEFRAYFDASWGARLTLHPYDAARPVYLLYPRFQYGQLAGSGRDGIPPLSLYRSDADTIIAHTNGAGTEDLPDLLIHQAAHQLVRHRLFGDREPLPWIEEGLAQYFGNMERDRDGNFAPQEFGSKNCWLFRTGTPWVDKDPAGARLRRYIRLVRRKQARPLADLLAVPPGSASGGIPPLEGEPAAWMLVHFLMHGDRGKHLPAFVRYLERAIRGPVKVEDFHREIHMTPEQLQAAVDRHVWLQG